MKIVAISDSHLEEENIKLTESCDILVFAGDCDARTKDDFEGTVKWLKTAPAKHTILVPGNHDFYCEKNSDEARTICADNDIVYLEHESVKILGIKFFGSPHTPLFFNWAYMRSELELEKLFNEIPEDTEVLITHGPCYGILDKCPNGNVGSKSLLERVKVLKEKSLRYHIVGHIHESAGMKKIDKMTFLNAAVLDGRYKPYKIDWKERTLII